MKKIDFIYHSINDAREIIKMMDLKANFLIFFIVLIIAGLLKFSSTNCNILKIITIFVGFGIILFLFWYVFGPRLNPEEEINNSLKNEYKKLFFPVNINDYKYYSELFKNTDENILSDILLFERLKLQIIVEQKIKYFNIAVYKLFPIYILLVSVCILCTD